MKTNNLMWLHLSLNFAIYIFVPFTSTFTSKLCDTLQNLANCSLTNSLNIQESTCVLTRRLVDHCKTLQRNLLNIISQTKKNSFSIDICVIIAFITASRATTIDAIVFATKYYVQYCEKNKLIMLHRCVRKTKVLSWF